MEGRRVRLGDVIDDYCPRCHLLMNHGVVSIVGDEVKKVRCNTCMSEHAYRHGKLPAARRDAGKKLFDEVLRGIAKPEHAVPPAAATADGPDEAPSEGAEEPDGGESSPDPERAAGAPEPPPDAPPTPADHARVQRRLYTIRRSIGDKGPPKDPKKS